MRSNFETLADKELTRARSIHPGGTNSLHEGYAVLLEEVDELWDEVKKKSSQRDMNNILAELVQIAAMARKTAEDLHLVGVDRVQPHQPHFVAPMPTRILGRRKQV